MGGSYDYNSRKMNNYNVDFSAKEVIINGRRYAKFGKLCIHTLVFNVFKCEEEKTHKHVWVAFGSI